MFDVNRTRLAYGVEKREDRQIILSGERTRVVILQKLSFFPYSPQAHCLVVRA
jgi:hypothetical protein